MNNQVLTPIYSESSNCRDCYRCVRSCPAKAIQIRNSHAEILEERCTYCGTCVRECPNDVKKIRSDVDRVRMELLTGRRSIVSLAPSYVSEFRENPDNFVRALYKLGFNDVSETAIGAALVTEALDLYKDEHGEVPFISTACPSVVEMVRKYFPDNVKDLAPVPSPLQTHSAYLRRLYGDDIFIVFIGPCIAKKLEADRHPGFPDIALTFREVREWLQDENIILEEMDSSAAVNFIPSKAGRAAAYPIENGQIETSRHWMNHFFEADALSVSGAPRLISSLRGEYVNVSEFLEALNCDGGCINGPGVANTDSALIRKRAVGIHVAQRMQEEHLFEGDSAFAREVMEQGYGIIQAEPPETAVPPGRRFTEAEIAASLRKLGKQSKEDELNCGGCGYRSCREMARALLDGLAEVEMCVTKMRLDAESKVDILMSTIPHGVVIVDRDLNIVELNRQFLEIFDDYPEDFFDASVMKSLKGMPLGNFVPFAEEFRKQLDQKEMTQYRFKHRGKVMRLTFFFVQNRMLLGALFEDITTPMIRREAIIKKAEDVITKSLSIVQQIASLLGENAADNEIVLKSIIDEFSVPDDTSEDYGPVEDKID
ncbi:MAG: 4Fe-4S binding protein [Firmicutes bacterium]|nr:4Fe-4S binding protein [Bacillota bacterium]